MYIIWETEVISSSVCVDDEHFSTHYFCIFPSFIQQNNNNTIHAVDDGVDVEILSGHIWHSTMVGNIPKPFEELRLQIFFFLVLLHFSYVSEKNVWFKRNCQWGTSAGAFSDVFKEIYLFLTAH